MWTKPLLKLFFALALPLALLHPGYAQSAFEGQAAPAKPSYRQPAPSQAIPPAPQNRSKKLEAPQARGLLWKIESPGVRASYLFGTIHSDDARITQLPPAVKQRFDHATSFTMELIANGAGIVDMAEAMFFNDGQTLEKVLGKDLYAQTLQALTSRGLPTQGIEKQKPWVIMMSLSMPKPKSGLVLDLYYSWKQPNKKSRPMGWKPCKSKLSYSTVCLWAIKCICLRRRCIPPRKWTPNLKSCSRLI